MTSTRRLFITTAVGEGVTGALLLLIPSVVLRLLFGMESAGDETTIVARLAGAALLTIGLMCWANRSEQGSSRDGLLLAILIYDIAAGAILIYAGVALRRVGLALWPAVILHAALAVWCIMCRRDRAIGGAP